MPIRLGTVAPVGFDNFPPREWLGALRQLGCTVAQVYRNPARKVSTTEIRDALAAGGLPCDSIHGVFGESFDPSAPDEAARRFAADTYKSEGLLAAELGGPLVVVHCSTVREQGVDPAERAVRVRQLRRSIEELGLYGQSIGVRYAFENLPGYHPVGADVAELASILKDVSAPNTGLCLDSGHANMTGNAVAAVGDAAGQIIYMHFSDNSGKADEHEMPTYASLDADGIARALYSAGYQSTMMLEVFYSIERMRLVLADGGPERFQRLLSLASGRL